MCQVTHPAKQPVCPAQESGGLWCERTDEHGDDHRVSTHTIEHAILGNGYACCAVPS